MSGNIANLSVTCSYKIELAFKSEFSVGIVMHEMVNFIEYTDMTKTASKVPTFQLAYSSIHQDMMKTRRRE